MRPLLASWYDYEVACASANPSRQETKIHLFSSSLIHNEPRIGRSDIVYVDALRPSISAEEYIGQSCQSSVMFSPKKTRSKTKSQFSLPLSHRKTRASLLDTLCFSASAIPA